MQRIKYTLPFVALLLTTTACGDKKSEPTANPADTTAVMTNSNAPYADASLQNEFTAKLGGKSYHITISRKADSTLPVVTDELGKQFYDNRVEVNITCDGTDFFHKSYTKEAFADFLSSAEKEGTVLLGMAFDSEKSDGHAIRLGAQIGQVGIEEGPAFSIEIPLNGGASGIVRDKNQDNTGNDGITD